MTIFAVRHATVYRYRQSVGFGPHRMMLHPLEGHDQQLLDFHLRIAPEPAGIEWSEDVLGNRVATAHFRARAAELRFESAFRIEQLPSHPDGFGVDERARAYPFDFAATELADLAPYRQRSDADAEGRVEAFAHSFLPESGATPTLDLLAAIARVIRAEFAYSRRVESGIQPPAETLALRRGTCRDFAVLMIAAARALGLPARFVSGYLYVPSRDRRRLHGGGSTHAWAQAYLPGAGWIDFDPTNAIVGNDGLIRVAVAREPEQALPLHGTYSGFRSDDLGMEVFVVVTREPTAAGRMAGTDGG
jgi:transglutaminase-like putative cysteine protease